MSMITLHYLFTSREKTVSSPKDKFLEPPPNPFFKIFVGIVVITFVLMAKKPFLEYDENGIPRLATWRIEKMEKEIKDFEGAEQYALRAGTNGWYPCYSCPDTTHLYLYIGQVWKYGITTKGEKGRYGKANQKLSLNYEIQYEGDLAECLKQERLKIYSYALLPENLARKKPLIRPPGNKNDS